MIFDAHLHIIDPRFPLTPNQGYLPPTYTAADYRSQAEPLGVTGGAIVSGSFQAFDQTYLLAALEALGPAYVGVTQLPPAVSDSELLRLNDAGVRAVRFNLKRGGSADVKHLREFALRVDALVNWHVEMYVDSRELDDLFDTIVTLPGVVIDHLGLSAAGLPTLYRLIERGVRVKATGFSRLDFDPTSVLQRIAQIDPTALLFGTDLPSTRAPRPFAASDIALLVNAIGPDDARLALHDNAVALYRPEAILQNANRK